MSKRPIFIADTIQASHLILMGYGHWLPNDPRGSGSEEVRKLGLTELGEIHFGRKRVQPSREELKAFYKVANPRLDHPVIWFDDNLRACIADTIGEVARERGWTIWALAILRNHLHAVMRTHKDDSLTMLCAMASATIEALDDAKLIPENHPVWGSRPYKVYLKTEEQIRGRIAYVEQNPIKEGLSRQVWECVRAYGGR